MESDSDDFKIEKSSKEKKPKKRTSEKSNDETDEEVVKKKKQSSGDEGSSDSDDFKMTKKEEKIPPKTETDKSDKKGSDSDDDFKMEKNEIDKVVDNTENTKVPAEDDTYLSVGKKKKKNIILRAIHKVNKRSKTLFGGAPAHISSPLNSSFVGSKNTPRATPTTPSQKITSPRGLISPRFSKKTPRGEENKIPEESEVLKKFNLVIDNMGFTDPKKRELVVSKYPTLEDKWSLVEMMKSTMSEKKKDSADKFIEDLKKNPDLNSLKKLNIQLSTCPLEWMKEFLNMNGLLHLSKVLEKSGVLNNDNVNVGDKKSNASIPDECVKAYYSILNTVDGMKAFIKEKEYLKNLLLIMDSLSSKLKKKLLFLLSLICYYSKEGLELTLQAFNNYKLIKREAYRFFNLVKLFKVSDDSEIKLHCLILFNSILTSGTDDLKFQLQQEFSEIDLLKDFDEEEFSDQSIMKQVNVYKQHVASNVLEAIEDPVSSLNILLKGLPPKNVKILNGILKNFMFVKKTEKPDEQWVVLEKNISKIFSFTDVGNEIRDIYSYYSLLRKKLTSHQKIFASVEENYENDLKTILYLLKGKITAEDLNTSILKFQSKSTKRIIKNIIKKNMGIFNESDKRSSVSSITVSDGESKDQSTENDPKKEKEEEKKEEEKKEEEKKEEEKKEEKKEEGQDTIPPPPSQGDLPPPPPSDFPPPPPMNIKAENLPKLPKYKQSVKTRKFHVDGITRKSLMKTIFILNDIAKNTNDLEIDGKEIEHLFGIKAAKLIKRNTQQNIESQKKGSLTLIDKKRSHVLALKLASVKVKMEDLVEGVMKMDKQVITPDLVLILDSIMPTDEEIKLVKEYTGDLAMLSKADLFVLKMAKIPQGQKRIGCWRFKNSYDEDIGSSLRTDIESIIFALEKIKNDEYFMEFLTIVLGITNYLNGGASNYGFKLTTLSKLHLTKTTDKKSTLLEYIILYIEKNCKQVLKFYEGLSEVSICKRLSLAPMKEKIALLNVGLKNLSAYMRDIAKLKNSDDQFEIKMKPFFKKIKSDYVMIKSRFEFLENELKEVAELFNENEKEMLNSPEKFFENLDFFIETFKNTYKSILKKRESLEKAKKMNEKKMQKMKEQEQKKLDKKETDASTRSGILKDLEKMLMDGSGFERKTSVSINNE